jgi:phenylpropionate dioxygenase-like ring-hydroxylating dioxygenase large terminal subunit
MMRGRQPATRHAYSNVTIHWKSGYMNASLSVVRPPDSLASIQQPLAEARHLPGAIYASDEFWRMEKERLFMTEWLMVCREEELPKAGDYIATRIMGEPVLIVRNKNGALVAMANVCRHRGVEIAMGRGNVRLFVCPYHAWGYELDGRLRGVPSLGPGREKPADCNLWRFHLEIWRGCVFVNMSSSPRSFQDFIAPFESEFAFLQLDRCRLARTVEFEMKCNWKLSLENLIDIYHVGTVHAKTFGGFYRKDRDDFRFHLMPDGSVSFFEDAAPLTSTGKSLTGAIPWLDRPETFAAIGLLWPNLRLSARSDYLRVWNIWPLAPDRTRMVCHMLFPPHAFEQPDLQHKLDVYEEFLRKAIEEDRAMVESLQIGVTSRHFIPGPLSNLESGIHHFLNRYVERMST